MVYDFTPVPGHKDVYGGFANLKVDGVVHDVLVLGTGLLLIAVTDRSGPGIPRLNQVLQSAPVADLIRAYRFIGYGDIARAKIVKRTPLRVELELADGRPVSLVAGWTTPLLTKESDKVLFELLTTRPVAAPAGPVTPAGPVAGRDGAAGPAVRPPVAADAAPGRLFRDGCDINASCVLGALANVKVNDAAYDVVVLDVGLVLIAEPGPFEHGRERLTRLVQGAPAYAIAAWNWLIRYEEVVTARITKDIPLRAELGLYGGRQLDIKEPWTTQSLTDDCRTALTHALMSVGAGPD